MPEFALALAVTAALANLVIGKRFVESMRDEAPELLAALAFPDPRQRYWRMKARLRYCKLILLRGYRSQLARYPASRAWASWLFLLHWIQLGAVLVFAAATAVR